MRCLGRVSNPLLPGWPDKAYEGGLGATRTSAPLITRSLSFDRVPFTLTFPGITDLLSDMCPINPLKHCKHRADTELSRNIATGFYDSQATAELREGAWRMADVIWVDGGARNPKVPTLSQPISTQASSTGSAELVTHIVPRV